MMNRLSLTLLSLLFLLNLRAEELPRPVASDYRLEIGTTSAISTYLSPLRYEGTQYRFGGEWSKAAQWNPENMIMDFRTAFGYNNMLNPTGTAQMLGIDGDFGFGLAWRKRLPNNLQLTIGGDTEIYGGALYLTRNGNNPVSILASGSLGLTGSISWHTAYKGLPILISNTLRMPAISCFFMPEYGETYYEIYLGNYKGLAHAGWPGNNFSINNLLSVKLDFGKTALEIGYRYDYRSFYANNLLASISKNAIVIGIIPNGIGLKKHSKINSSLY